MRNRSLCILILLLKVFVYAQEIPTLKVKDQNVGLSSLAIKVDIIGHIATTTYDMLYYNPTNEILEGELSFPLGKGHNVSRFALEVNGKLRAAVIVDKELGRIAFEQVVRAGVDPALLEKGTGNNYKARIYPIPANGYKRVVLAYEQELLFDEGAHFYSLPLNFKNTLKDFNLEILVYDQNEKPIVTEGEMNGLKFSNWKNTYKTSVSNSNYTPNKSLLIKIPVPKDVQKIIIQDNYFYVYKTLLAQTRFRKKPQNINLYWDVSLSMIERDFEKEKAFINSYLKYLGEPTINLITFSNTIKFQKTFTIKNGNTEDLINTLKHLVYDGGTNYDVLLNATKNADAIMLFTDGMASLSELNMIEKVPVFIVNSITKTNPNLLNTISEKSNGSYIDLNTTSNSEALLLAKSESFKFLSYETNSKHIEVYPKPGVSVNSDFSIAGKNFNKGEQLRLNFGYDNDIKQTVLIDLDKTGATIASVKRIWAQKKLNDLEIKSKENKAQIKAIGLAYNLVTDYTSLIVLDNVRDYIKYKISPPEELQEAYNKVLAQIEAKANKNKTATLGLLNAFSNDTAMDMEIEAPISIEYRIAEGINSHNFGYTNSNEHLEIDDIVVEEMNEEIISHSEVVSTRNDSVYSISSLRLEESDDKEKKYSGKLEVKKRTLKTDYIKALSEAKTQNEAYRVYLTQRNDYLTTPAYYMDVSNHFATTYKDTPYAALIVSNIAETDFDNYELLKVFAYQSQYDNKHEMAIFMFKRILELRPEDAQSYRDLALAYQNAGKCQKALDLLNSILTGKIYENGNRRVFEGLELIAQNEIKHLIKNYKNDLDLSEIDSKLIDDVYYDIRVVVDWNHNDTDIDLHIIDPKLEECFYSHPNTKIGGQLSPDMTAGFGPEEFTLRKAIKGDYFVKIKYYGDRYQKIENPTFMKVTVYKNYGSKDESKSVEVVRLTKADDEVVIAKIRI